MIGCIIQARMGSSRLPGKVMKPLDADNPLLYSVLFQLKNCEFIEEIVVATTDLEEDDVIEQYLKKNNIKCFRGSSDDVLDRYYQCAKKFSFSTIIRIPADKPFIDPEFVDTIIKKFNMKDLDYITTFLPPTFPIGSEVEVFSFECLEKTWKNAKLPSEREHVTSYIYNNKDKFKILNIENDKDESNFRWAVDREEDYKLALNIMSEIKNRPILTRDIINLFKRNPDLTKINNKIDKDEGMKKSTLQDKQFLIERNGEI